MAETNLETVVTEIESIKLALTEALEKDNTEILEAVREVAVKDDEAMATLATLAGERAAEILMEALPELLETAVSGIQTSADANVIREAVGQGLADAVGKVAALEAGAQQIFAAVAQGVEKMGQMEAAAAVIMQQMQAGVEQIVALQAKADELTRLLSQESGASEEG